MFKFTVPQSAQCASVKGKVTFYMGLPVDVEKQKHKHGHKSGFVTICVVEAKYKTHIEERLVTWVGVSVLHPNDEPNMSLGCKLALERALVNLSYRTGKNEWSKKSWFTKKSKSYIWDAFRKWCPTDGQTQTEWMMKYVKKSVKSAKP